MFSPQIQNRLGRLYTRIGSTIYDVKLNFCPSKILDTFAHIQKSIHLSLQLFRILVFTYILLMANIQVLPDIKYVKQHIKVAFVDVFGRSFILQDIFYTWYNMNVCSTCFAHTCSLATIPNQKYRGYFFSCDSYLLNR